MRNQRLVKLLDEVIREFERDNWRGWCECCYRNKERFGDMTITHHYPTCPVPKLYRERYEAGRERDGNTDPTRMTKSFLRRVETSYLEYLLSISDEGIDECQRGILNPWPYDASHWRNRKTRLEYRVSQLRKELYRRSVLVKERV